MPGLRLRSLSEAARTRVAVVGLAVLSAVLRLPYLDNQSQWLDETFTRAIALSGSPADVWRGVQATESTPPLFYLLEWAWMRLTGSDGDAALRVVPALAGIAVAPVALLALRRLTGERVAFGAGVLAALSPVLHNYALNARAYTLLVLLTLLSIWALVRVLGSPGWGRGCLWALAAGAAMWTHYFAIFTVAVEVVVLLVCLPGAALRRRAVAWSALAAAFTAPVLLVLADQRDDRAAFIGQSGLGPRAQTAVREFAMGPNVPSAGLEAAGLLLAGAGLLAGAAWFWRRGRDGRIVLALAVAPILVPLLVALAGFDEQFLMRNLLVAWVPLAAVVAAGLWRLRGVPLALYSLLGLVTLIWVQGDWRLQNPDVRGAVRVLEPLIAGAPVLTFPAADVRVASRYLRRVQRPSVTADVAWVLVSSARSNDRTLEAVPGLPRALPPGFAPTGRRLEVHGVRMLEVRASGPVALNPQGFGLDDGGRPGALLAP